MATVLPLPATTDVQIVRVVKALYDAAPGNTYLTAFREFANNNGGVAAVANAILPTSDKTKLADLIVANLKLTGDAATNGKAYLLAQFNAPGANIGQVIVDAMNALAGLGNDPTFGAAANAFNASIAQAYAYSINTSNTTTVLATLQAADEVQVDKNGNPVQQGQTFTLTTVVGENVVGTTGNDEFRAVMDATGTPTFDVGDSIDGKEGTDTLNMFVADTYALPAGSQIKNVEIINLIEAGGNFSTTDVDVSKLGSVQQVWLKGWDDTDDLTNGTSKFLKVGAGVTIGLDSVVDTNAAALAIEAEFTKPTGAFALNGVKATNGDITLTATGAAATAADTLRTIDVSGNVHKDSEGVVTLVDGAVTDTIRAVNLALTGTAVEFNVDGVTALRTLDASKSTANLTATINASANNNDLTKITLGSGADNLTLTTSDKAIEVNLGAGNDIIDITTTNGDLTANREVTVNLGEGKDKVVVSVINNIFDAASYEDGLVTINGFTIGSNDVLDLSALGVAVANLLDSSELDLVAAKGSFAEAFAEAASYEAISLFHWEGDTYVYYDQDTNGALSDGDGLVKIVGVADVEDFVVGTTLVLA